MMPAMTRRATTRGVAAVVAIALVAPAAWAQPRTMQVLKSEGRVDNNIKVRVDAAIIKLARTTDAVISPGDITMSDAAAAVGCKLDVPGCKDEILSMLAVDELVYSTVFAKPGATDVIAYRVSKGGVTREARATILAGNPPDKIDGIATLFMSATSPPDAAVTTQPDVVPPGTEITTTTETTRITEPVPAQSDEPTAKEPAVEQAYLPYDEPSEPSRLPLIGMIGGGALILLSFASWAKAGDIQDQINDSPSATRADIEHIRSLEREGDDAASAGNVLFVIGAVVGGVSTYAWFRQRRQQQARWRQVGATPLPGNGVGITWGGTL